MSSKEEKLTKELEEMFAREHKKLDKSHEKTVENHKEIMQMIEATKIENHEKIMQIIEATTNTPERGEENQTTKKIDTCSEEGSLRMQAQNCTG